MLPGWDIILNNVYTQSDRCQQKDQNNNGDPEFKLLTPALYIV